MLLCTNKDSRDLFLDVSGKGHLVSGSNGNLLPNIIASRADIDQIDSAVTQLFGEDGGLIETPTRMSSMSAITGCTRLNPCSDGPESPFSVTFIVLDIGVIGTLSPFVPIGSRYTEEQWLVPL